MVFVFLGELLVLFFLSRAVTRELSFLFYRITRSKTWAIRLLAILFLPGTAVHELSHAVTAEILFVRTHGITLMPQLEGDTVKLGSVQVQKTDFIRSFFIGIAPFVIGTGVLLATIWMVTAGIIPRNVFTLTLVGYLVFTVSNTMFSSKRDLRGAIEFTIIAIIVAIVVYFLGIRIHLTPDLEDKINNAAKLASLFLAIPLVIDIAVVLLSRLFTRRG